MGKYAYRVHPVNGAEEREEKLTLELLNAIDQRSDLSQRHLSRQMGIALGLTNSYLKRCARKGLVKVSEAPANRYFYYLTPKGFAEKARLTGQYLANSLTFYRRAGDSCSALFHLCRKKEQKRVLLVGISELTEIALIRALDTEVDIIGIYAPDSSVDVFLARQVWSDFADVEPFDVCLVTELESPYEVFRYLVSEIGKDKILLPDVLGIKVKNE